MIERLLAEPQRFEFFQAVRLLLLWLEERGVPPQQALDGHLRFANSLSLCFPASQVEALSLVHDKPPPGAEPPIGARPQFRLTPSFMGLLGAHGTLPAHYTERIQAWVADEDEAPRAFLDMFSTRMLALFYGAWKKYRVEHLVAGPRDRYLPMLLALAGFAPGVRAPLPGVGEQVLALHAGLLRERPASAAVLAQVLAAVLGVPVSLQPCSGRWERLAPAERSALGGVNAVLGQAALLGERSWRPELRACVRIGPLDSARFARFLPGADGAAALRSLIVLFGAPTLCYDVVLVLRRADVQGLSLGGPINTGRVLGLDTYLLTAPAAADRADMRYLLRPLAPLA